MKRSLPTALWMMLLVASTSLAQDAGTAIDDCLPKLNIEIDVGYERIAERCPALSNALENSGWAAWLPRGWKESGNDLSAGSLMELRDLAARELAVQSNGRAPDVGELKRVLADLGTSAQERGGVWARFKAWLRTALEANNEATDDSTLARLIRRHGLSQTIIEIITYCAYAVIVALAVLIVFNELRHAGLLKRASRAGKESVTNATGARLSVSMKDIEAAPLFERPRLLLSLIISRLSALGRLPPPGALTVRELTRAAQLQEPDDRQRLSQLALATERVRFSDDDAPVESVESAVQQGRELLDRLDGDGKRA